MTDINKAKTIVPAKEGWNSNLVRCEGPVCYSQPIQYRSLVTSKNHRCSVCYKEEILIELGMKENPNGNTDRHL